MATRLTESRLRQVIRAELLALNEGNLDRARQLWGRDFERLPAERPTAKLRDVSRNDAHLWDILSVGRTQPLSPFMKDWSPERLRQWQMDSIWSMEMRDEEAGHFVGFVPKARWEVEGGFDPNPDIIQPGAPFPDASGKLWDWDDAANECDDDEFQERIMRRPGRVPPEAFLARIVDNTVKRMGWEGYAPPKWREYAIATLAGLAEDS
jgi:hypothetical protein